MGHFPRVIRIAFQQRWTVVGIVATSLIIAGLWGSNIATLYPMVEIVFKDSSLPEHIDSVIDRSKTRVAEIDQAIALLQSQSTNDTDKRRALDRRIQYQRSQRERAQAQADWYLWMKPTIDRYAPKNPFQTLTMIVVLLLVGTFVKLLALSVNIMLVQRLSQLTASQLRELFFRRSLHLDMEHFSANGSADLTARLTNDINQAAVGVKVLVGKLIREPLKMAVCFCGAAFVCWRLLLLILIVSPLTALFIRYISKKIRAASARVMEETSSLYSALADAYTGIRVVKAYSTHSRERAKVAQSSRMMYRKSLRLEGYNALARSMTEMMGMTVVSLAILAGGYLVIRGKTDLLGLPMTNEPLQTGDILLFFGFLIGLSDPVRKLNEVWTELQRGVAAAHRIFEIVDHPVRVKNVDAGQQQIPARPHATLQFQDVQYHYSSGPAVLRGANLTIPHGETVAIVGPNGCGKSTLISLLCRFDDTRSGEISLDGIPLTLIPLRELRRRTALVSQQTVMFDGTIADNIRYGSPGAHDAAVRRAAELAFADEFIREKTENGYETLLGKGGVKLSGGQMQRIALARAILRDPDILILDEATSQIDLESEQLIHQALSKFLKGRTGIMITHRPTSLQLADRIVVMEQGEISDSGRHDQLMGKNAFYNSLCGIEDSDAEHSTHDQSADVAARKSAA